MAAAAFVVHNVPQARAALAAARAANRPVMLRSAPAAAATIGPAVFREMVALARADFPGVDSTAVLDCAGDSGFALAALRAGIEAIRVEVRADVRARIADIARRAGARLDDDAAPALDLLELAPDRWAEACRAWIEREDPRENP